MRIARSRWIALLAVVAGLPAQAQMFEGLDLTGPAKKPAAKPKPTELVVKLEKEIGGAKLLIDNEAIGELPMGPKEVAPGEHTLAVERIGYKTAEQKFTVVKGKLNEVTMALEAEGGILTVESNEPGSVASIDGAAPLPVPLVTVLPPGRHEVRVSKPGFTTDVETINADLGVDVVVGAELQPMTASAVPGSDRPLQAHLEPGDSDSDLDLERGGAGSTQVSKSGGAPLYKQWYVWAGVGAVVAGGVAVAVVASQPKGRPVEPSTVCGGPCDLTIGTPIW